MEQKPKTYKSLGHILIICFTAVLSILAYSFSINSMNNPLHIMIIVFRVPKVDKGLYQGMLQCSVYIGCLIGATLGLYLIRFGNRVCFYIIDLSIIFGSALLFSDDFYIFMTGRIIVGLGCGMAPSVTSYFLRQFCPIEIYGFVAGLNPTTQIIFLLAKRFSVGLIITQICGLFFQDEDNVHSPSEIQPYWRFYFTVFPITVCVIRLILLQFVLKFDSPMHYVMMDDDQKAVEVLEQIYKPEYVSDVLSQIQQDCYKQKNKKSILSKPYGRRFYFAMFLQLLTANSGYNAVSQFSTDIFTDIFNEDIAEDLTLLIAIVKFIFYSICFTLSHKYGINYYKQGRRKLFIYGNFVMLVMNFSIGALSKNQDDYHGNSFITVQYILVVCIYIYFIANFLSLPPLVSIYLPEILPSIGVQYTWVLYWLCQIYILLLFPIVKYLNQIYIQRQAVGLSYCFFFFGSFNILGQIAIHYYLVETKDASQQKIEEFYYPSARNQIQEETFLSESID